MSDDQRNAVAAAVGEFDRTVLPIPEPHIRQSPSLMRTTLKPHRGSR